MDKNTDRLKGKPSTIEAKWDLNYEKNNISLPADVLLENVFLLPKKGSALDLACGLGANALFLAEKGLHTHAWDISTVALERLQLNAQHKQLKVLTRHVFLEPDVLPKNTFDVIVITRFLDRKLSNAIMESLKPNGLLFYQTYVRDKLASVGPNNPSFLLARNELIHLFKPLKIVLYKENNLIGDLQCGERNEALFVGHKC
ncbi:MAG: class I SAM-dependent methyltransferase [Methylococcaceae bacterium]|nr:class I SAM-dependent methyltransferase [Methylococcaceae bacterium]